MSKPVRPRVYMIASTMPHPAETQRWLRDLGVSDGFRPPGDDEVSPSELPIALAAKRCYMSFEVGLNKNVTRVRERYDEYFENILRSGHGSVLEHASYTFAIEGVSRVFTAEMNRHRAGWAISEGSMRFIRFDECIPWVEPPSIRGESPLSDGDVDDFLRDRASADGMTETPPDDMQLAIRKQLTRAIFDDVFSHVERRYAQLLEVWDMDESDKNFAYKKLVTSCLRRIVPLGVATGGVWTGNVRALRHVLAMRCAPSAEEEICEVFSMIAKGMRDAHPLVFGDFELVDGYWAPRYWKV